MGKTKPHAKVHISVRYHIKTADVWSDLQKRGMLVELWRLALEQYAPKRANKVWLRPVDRLAITCSESLVEADSMLSELLRDLKYKCRKYPNRWDVTIRNLAEKHGISGANDSQKSDLKKSIPKPKKEERREKREERRTDTEQGGGEVGEFPDIDPDDHSERIARKLRLGSKATPAERAEFVAAIFQTEVIPAARSEWSGRGSFWDVVTRILSARWNAYLNRERDPTRRPYYREASAREKRAALDRFEAEQESEPPDPPVDPLLSKLAEIQSKRGAA